MRNQLSTSDRIAFSKELASRIESPQSFLRKKGDILKAGTAGQSTSELPLIAEFLVRNGEFATFLNALRKAALHPGLTLLLMALEDIIAFNFTVFTSREYDELESVLPRLEQRLVELNQRPKPSSTEDKNTVHHVSRELAEMFAPLREAIRRAKYFYVQRGLQVSKRETIPDMSTTPLPNTISASAPTLAELQQLPRERQALLLLRRLAHLYPKGQSFARSNCGLDSHLGPDPYGLVTGYPREVQKAAIQYLLGVPWQELERQHFIYPTISDQGFVEITDDGWAVVSSALNIQSPNRVVIEALMFLHRDLQGYSHYFRESKLKEAVAAAFTRVENRLNEIRDSQDSGSQVATSGTALPHKLYERGVLKFPHAALAASNPQARSAYEQSSKNYLSAGIGWFRNSYNHKPHNLPALSPEETLELLFVASNMLRLIEQSL